MVESDCPWCEIRPSHASYPILQEALAEVSASHKALGSSGGSDGTFHAVQLADDEQRTAYAPAQVKKERWTSGKSVKGRNEPCSTAAVAAVVAKLKGVSLQEVADVTRRNTENLFPVMKL